MQTTDQYFGYRVNYSRCPPLQRFVASAIAILTPFHYNHAVETKDFRKYLQSEFAKRCGRNARYSLRTFARQLKTNPGTLSQILSGKRALSNETVKKLGDALGLDPKTVSGFVVASAASSANSDIETVAHSRTAIELAYDTFNSISDYYHDAILELTHTKNFIGDIGWVARRLKISLVETRAAVERLQRLGFLRIDDQGKWVDVYRDNTNDLDSNFTNSAMRKHQEQILNLSKEALENIPRQQRDHVSNIFACNPDDIPEIKKRINKFRKELIAFIQRSESDFQEVCALNISIFPLSENENTETHNPKKKT